MARESYTGEWMNKQTGKGGEKKSYATNDVPASIMGPRIVILLVTLTLLLLGIVMVYSASSIVALNEGVSTANYLFKQLIYAGIGVVLCIAIWKFVPYRVWQGPISWIVWAGAIVLLVLVALVGNEGYGATRWVDLGPFSLQPSEFAKIIFLIMAAKILYEVRCGIMDFKTAAVHAFIFILAPLMLIYFTQSDLGTTLICFAGILMVLWLGEIPLKVIFGVIAAGVIFAVLASLVGYRADRFIFLNPWNDGEGGLGAGYQLIHSFFAFSQGGIFGVGLGNSREKFLYLPMSETDFIYAIIGEELGMIGALVVIALFILFLWAGLRIARSAPDLFGTLLAGGLSAMIVFQAFLNIGCVLGVFPTTGKPLPFISSGGSSLIASLMMLGLVLSVSQNSNVKNLYERRRDDLRVVRTRGQEPRTLDKKRENSSSRRKNDANSNKSRYY